MINNTNNNNYNHKYSHIIGHEWLLKELGAKIGIAVMQKLVLL